MADKYSTIQQHQPLRVPNSFDKQGRALIVQLDEIFDDIYRRFGRLKVSDFGSQLQDLCLVKDEDGKYVSVQSSIEGIETDIHDQLGNYYTKSETASQISTSIGNALGDYYTKTETATQISTAITSNNGNYYTKTETADEISLALVDYQGKSTVVRIDSSGLDILSGGRIRIRNSGDTASLFVMDSTSVRMVSGGTFRVVSGSEFKIESGSTFSVVSTNFSLSPQNELTFKGGGEILSSRTLYINSGARLHIRSGGDLEIASGGELHLESGSNMYLKSGANFYVQSGGSMEFYSGGTMDFKSGSTLKFTASGNSKIEISGAGIDIASGKYVKIASGTSGYWKYDDYGLTFYNTSNSARLQLGDHSAMLSSVIAGIYAAENVVFDGWVAASNGVVLKATNNSVTKKIGFGIYEWANVNRYSFGPFSDADIDLGNHLRAWKTVYCDNLMANNDGVFYGYLGVSGNVSLGSNSANTLTVRSTSTFNETLYYSSLVQSSSKDIKHDIQPMTSFGSKIDQLKTVSFVYDRDSNENRRYGLIYEDTLPVFPEICTKDESSKAVNYIELIPMLVKEIQELRLRMAAVEGS